MKVITLWKFSALALKSFDTVCKVSSSSENSFISDIFVNVALVIFSFSFSEGV